MSHISKHDSKEEWESDTSKDRRIDLFVHWDTVGVNNLLEWPREVICLDVGRWCDIMSFEFLKISSRMGLQYLS